MSVTQDNESRKEYLLNIGGQLFYEQGYNATGIKQIIDEAGIAKGTFYSHFKSKEDLGVSWLKQRHHQWSQMFQEKINARARTPQKKLLAAFDIIKEWMDDSGFRGCAFLNTMAETPDFNSPLRKEVQAHKRELLEYIRSLVDAHLDKASSEKRLQIARSLFLLMESSIIEYQNFREDWAITASKKAAQQILST